MLGPRCFSSNTPSNDTDQKLKLPSTTQIAVLTNELSDQLVLLKIASNLIGICSANVLVKTSFVYCVYISELLWLLLLY